MSRNLPCYSRYYPKAESCNSRAADVLGDPNFPNKIMSVHMLASKIVYIQDIYMRYSRLRLPKIQDRPLAIARLEKRLLRAFHTSGGFDIFSDIPNSSVFHCSLLWQRGGDQDSIVAIDFAADRRVPS